MGDDGFNNITLDPVTGQTKIVGFGSEGSFEVSLHPMPDCECSCSGVVTHHDGVFYGAVTHATAMRGALNSPRGVEGTGAEISSLREQGEFTDVRPRSELPRHASED